jgi:uncharacterized protein
MVEIPKSFKMIAEFITGSHLYGNATLESDLDIRGVFIPDENYFYGFMHRGDQLEDKVNDVTYYEIRKFMKLALDNNPNIIEFLFIPEDKYLDKTNEWDKILENRDLFISKKAKFTFSGYAHSQFNRVKRHRNWLLNPPKKKPERSDYGLDNTRSNLSQEQIGAFNVLLSMYLDDIRQFHDLRDQIEKMVETHNFRNMCQSMKRMDYDAVRSIIPISDNFIDVLDREKAYMNAKREWDQYQNWKKNRNPIRAKLEEQFGYDTKHISHLFRLMSEGKELLETGYITFPRPDAEFLNEVKNGCFSYEELLQRIQDYDKFFDELYETSPLPHSPNRKKADMLCQDIVKNYLEV